jgi:large subunit ribosomal protein L28
LENIAMSRVCQVTEKRFGKGRTYSRRGIAKKNKGIGINITGWAKRQHRPNLHVKSFFSPTEKRMVKLKLSSHGLRIIDKKGVDAVLKSLRAKGVKV